MFPAAPLQVAVESQQLPPGAVPSASPSPNAAFDSQASIVISDSIPMLTLSTWLDRCPTSNQLRTVRVNCATKGTDAGVIVAQQASYNLCSNRF